MADHVIRILRHKFSLFVLPFLVSSLLLTLDSSSWCLNLADAAAVPNPNTETKFRRIQFSQAELNAAATLRAAQRPQAPRRGGGTTQLAQRERTEAPTELRIPLNGAAMSVASLSEMLLVRPRGAAQAQPAAAAAAKQSSAEPDGYTPCPQFQPWRGALSHISACKWSRPDSAFPASASSPSVALRLFMIDFLEDKRGRAAENECRDRRWIWPRPLVTGGEVCVDEADELQVDGDDSNEDDNNEEELPELVGAAELMERVRAALGQRRGEQRSRLEANEADEVGEVGALGGGGVLRFSDVFVNSKGTVFNESHVFAVDACGRGQWNRQGGAVKALKDSISFAPGTRVSVHEHLVNLLPYEQEEAEQQAEEAEEAEMAERGLRGTDWVAQARLHNGKERLLARLLPALYLVATALMPAARQYPLLLRSEHLLEHLGGSLFGVDLASLCWSIWVAACSGWTWHRCPYTTSRLINHFFSFLPFLFPPSPATIYHIQLLEHLGGSMFGVDLASLSVHHLPASRQHGDGHRHLFYAKTLFMPVHASSVPSMPAACAASPPPAARAPLLPSIAHPPLFSPSSPPTLSHSPPTQPVHASSVCGLSSSGRPRAPDALWLALRGHHLLPPDGLPILSPAWTPRLPASAQPASSPQSAPPALHPLHHLAVGRTLPEDWVVVVSLVWSAHVMDRGGGGVGDGNARTAATRHTEEAMEAIAGMLRELYSEERVVVYEEHLPLRKAKALFSRTILLVGPTSPALSNLIFMPFNSTVIEILPYVVNGSSDSSKSKVADLQQSTAGKSGGKLSSQQSTATWHYRLSERVGVHHLLSVCDPGRNHMDESEMCHVDEVYAMVTASLRKNPVLREATGLPPVTFPPDDVSRLGDFRDFIPGSRLRKGTGQVAGFRRWAECVAERGEWRFNATPRVLAWPDHGVEKCDAEWEAAGGIASTKADKVAARGPAAAADWKVRDSLKYEWVVPTNKCPKATGFAAAQLAVPSSEPADFVAPGAPQNLAPLLRFRPQPAESAEPGRQRRRDRSNEAQHGEEAELQDPRDQLDPRDQREGDPRDSRVERERTGAAAALEAAVEGSSLAVLPLADLIRAPRSAQQLEWQRTQQQQQWERQQQEAQQQQQQAGGSASAAAPEPTPGVCPDFQPWGFFSPDAPSPQIHACVWRPRAADDTPTAALPVSKSSRSSSSAIMAGLSGFMQQFLADRAGGGGGAVGGGSGRAGGNGGAAVGGRSVAVQQDCAHWKWLWPRPLVTRGEMCLDEDEVREFVEEGLRAEQERQCKEMAKQREKQGLVKDEISGEERLELDTKEVFRRTQEAINFIEAERGARVVSGEGGEEGEEEKGEWMEVGMGGVVGQGGVVVLRDVFVDGRGVVFNASHVFSVHGACVSMSGGGRKRQHVAAQKLKKLISFPPGTPVSVHEHLVNLLPYEQEETEEEEGGGEGRGGGEGSGGGEWVEQARVHSGGTRGLVRLLPVLFLLASSLMPTARRFPMLLNHRHVSRGKGRALGRCASSSRAAPQKEVTPAAARFSGSFPPLLSFSLAPSPFSVPPPPPLLSHLGPDIFGVDLAPLAIHHPSALLHNTYSSDGSYNDPGSGPDTTTTGMPPHLFFARTLLLPIHTPSLCGLSTPSLTALHSAPPRAPDALWLALRGYHLLPPHGLPILSPDWTPRLPAPLQVWAPENSPEDSPQVSPEDSPDGLVVGRALPEDWVVVVSVVWSTHVMEGGGGGEGVRETEAAMHVIIAMLKELFSDGRVIVYDEHMPLLQVVSCLSPFPSTSLLSPTYPLSLPPAAKALFSRAILLVGPTSPALTNLLFMPFNSTLIELLPYPVTRPRSSLPLSLLLRSPYHKKAAAESALIGQPSAATWHCQLAERLGIRHYLSVCDLTWLDKSTGEQCHVDEVYATVLATVRRNPTLLALTGIPAIFFPPDAFQPTPEPPTDNPSDFAEAAGRFGDFGDLIQGSMLGNGISRLGDFSDFIPGSRLQKGTGQVADFRRWAACVAERGEWRFNATPRVLPWAERGFDNCDLFHVRENGGLAGAAADAVALDREMGREEREQAWKVRDALKYQWGVAKDRCPRVVRAKQGARAQAIPGSEVSEPDELFSRFDGRALCELARRRVGGLRIAFVGDSLTREAHISFVHSIVTHVRKPANVVTREDGAAWVGQLLRKKGEFITRATYRFDAAGAGCGKLVVHYIANRRLVPVGEEKRERVRWISTPWMESEEIKGAHVVVLNRGAHFMPTGHVVLSVSRALQFLRYNYPEKLIVYRATAPGHLNCKDYNKPLLKRQNGSDLPFHWGEFKAQNEAVRPIVEAMGGVFLDVDPLSALRPDGHRGFVEKMDCLHYCLPGPEDTWSEFLYNIIQRLVPVK
ncbi:unnamed protein product [Closterium sp. Naga37s-1]|nr:unnamed protein product [Closterium sp. Naga37s-1]